MTSPQDYSDLSDLFASEDANLEANSEQFVASVMQDISVKDTKRRWILAAAGLTGGVIAAAQVPELITSLSGLELSFSDALEMTKGELSKDTLQATPLRWVIAAVIAMSVMAVAQMEQA